MLYEFITKDNQRALKWLVEHGVVIDNENLLSAALTQASIDTLRLLKIDKHNLPSHRYANNLFNRAIRHNKLANLQWLANHYPFEPIIYADDIFFQINVNLNKFVEWEELIRWTIAQGLDLNKQNGSQDLARRLLYQVQKFGQEQVYLLDFLQEHGVDISAAIQEHGLNALMCAISHDASPFRVTKSGLSYLLAQNMPLNTAFTRVGDHPVAALTPLEYASSHGGKEKIVQQLLEAGADARFTPNPDATALHYACGLSLGANEAYQFCDDHNEQVAIIKLLLAAQAPVNIGQKSPLAVLREQATPCQEAIELLLAAGADPLYEINLAATVISATDETSEINTTLPDSSTTCLDTDETPSEANTTVPDSSTVCPDADKPQLTNQAKRIFMTTAPKNADYAQTGTGDIDYVNTLIRLLSQQNNNDSIVNAHDCLDEKALYAKIKHETLPGEQPVLHLFINPPHLGFMVTTSGLDRFKRTGGQIVITVVEFAKNVNRHNGDTLSQQLFDLVEKAQQVIFLDEHDCQQAQRYASKHQYHLPPTAIISVPATVAITPTPLLARGKDILSFGMIRAGKGFAHIEKLAGLIKNSSDPDISSKKILVVGKIASLQQNNRDATLYKLMKAIYPAQAKQMHGKTPYELVALYQTLSNDPAIKPALPIELHLNVAEADLPALFARCSYSYLPAYRGATLRNSSISSSIANSFVTYVHEGKITPSALLPTGEYADAVVLIPYRAEQSFYGYAAEIVLADIAQRDKEPRLNQATAMAAARLHSQRLAGEVIANQHSRVYQHLTLTVQSIARNTSGFFYQPANAVSTTMIATALSADCY